MYTCNNKTKAGFTMCPPEFCSISGAPLKRHIVNTLLYTPADVM